MASDGDMEANVEQQREIPVFTVVKNSAILKNIFLINSGSSFSETQPKDSSKVCQELDQILVVGRHPDCDIRLEHPSISRFHLQIHSKPSSKRLSVTDLSSVHGTWISGKRIEPNTPMDVNEGDALRIGLSSRVYKLHWIPFHKAYDPISPFLPPLDEEKEEEIKADENAPVLENKMQSGNSASPKDLLYNQFETSKEMKDKDEDEKDVVSGGCECSLDSALEAIKALVSNQFEASAEVEVPNGITDGDVLSTVPLPEAMKALDMPLESRDMQFVNFAWDGSETLLLDRSTLLVAPEESELSGAMHEDVNYSYDMVEKYEGMSSVLKLEDGMSISEIMEKEEDGEEQEVDISGSSTDPFWDLAVNPLEENEYEKEETENEGSKDLLFSQESAPTETQWESSSVPSSTSGLIDNLDGAITESFAECEYEKEGSEDLFFSQLSSLTENQWGCSSEPALTSNLMKNLDDAAISESFAECEYEKEGSEDLFFSQLSSLTDSQWGCSSEPALTSNLMKNLDDAVSSESFAEETNENLTPPCDDEEMGTAWNFWSLSNEETEGENTKCSLEEPSYGVTQNLLWSFWSGIPGAVHLSSLSHSPSSIHSMEVICSDKPSEGSSPYRSASSIGNNEAANLNVGEYDPIKRVLFEEEYITPKKEILALSTKAAEWKLGTLKDGIDSENSLASPYSNKENMTPKVITEKKSARHPSEENTKSSRLTKNETQRTPLRALFADSPQKSVSEDIFDASLSPYSNKEIPTPKDHQEQKSAKHSSAKCMKLSMQSKGEALRTPLQTLSVDSSQKSTSKTRTSGAASLSACFNKENQTPMFLQKEQKSLSHTSAKCMKLSVPSKGEQRMPLQALFTDSPQRSTSYTHTYSDASLSACSDKENQTPISAMHPSAGYTKLISLRKQEPKRTPFRTSFVDYPEKNAYENSEDKKKHSKRQVKRWTMLVDIASLLNKTSRKALQLLEGTKGTQIIIPKTVLNELDDMKQQVSFFRKNTDAYLASQWIEECAVRSKWWIQIPNPMEDDQILDHALYLKRIQNDGQLVLLSDDSTTKIQAMAQGLICETAEEFRRSLVKPFSKRFLWPDSLARGRAWSYLDDVIQTEKLYPGALKATSLKGVENAMGLKLILPTP